MTTETKPVDLLRGDKIARENVTNAIAETWQLINHALTKISVAQPFFVDDYLHAKISNDLVHLESARSDCEEIFKALLAELDRRNPERNA